MRALRRSSWHIFQITMILTIEWTTHDCSGAPVPDKLFAGQQAPGHALSSSAHSLRLAPPLKTRALTPANVGQLKPAKGGSPPAPKPPSPPSGGSAAPSEDGVTREEMTSLKEVDGQPVFVVVGSYAYESPDGLPVSFKYMADENGNKASFTIGAAAGGGGGGSGGSKPGGGAGSGSKGGGGGGSKGAGAGGGPKPGSGGGSGAGGDRMYLPPS